MPHPIESLLSLSIIVVVLGAMFFSALYPKRERLCSAWCSYLRKMSRTKKTVHDLNCPRFQEELG